MRLALEKEDGYYYIVDMDNTVFYPEVDEVIDRLCRKNKISTAKRGKNPPRFVLTANMNNFKGAMGCLELDASWDGCYRLPEELQAGGLEIIDFCYSGLKKLFGKIPNKIYYRIERVEE